MWEKRYRCLVWGGLSLLVCLWVCGCGPTPATTEVVVSDAITSNGPAGDPEIPCNATVYCIPFKEKKSLLKYLTAEKVAEIEVRFYARLLGGDAEDWIRLGDESAPLMTDAQGRVRLENLRQWLPSEFLDLAPCDLALRAEVVFEGGATVTDDDGILRLLEAETSDNPPVVFTDHDNTLHATGGQNSLADWIEFINWARDDWPLVDDQVAGVVDQLRAASQDVVIVSGMPLEIRALCRDQVRAHIEDGENRTMPLFIKSDLEFEHGYEFKAGALAILKALYGAENCRAMVGDTVREDGYGAYANRLFYIPFQVDYYLFPSLLDTQGYGFIAPQLIAWDWLEVGEMLAAGDPVSNYFLRNENGFLNIAHRGGRSLRPENTILAYRHALEVGSESLEGDVHATSDGVIVVSHDATVDRCTNGTGNIKDMSFEELRALDAGYDFTPDGGATFPYRGYAFEGADHLLIPTLEEVFGDPVLEKAPMVAEIKQQSPSIVDPVLDLIETYDMQQRLVLGSFNEESLIELRARAAGRGMDLVTSFATEEVLDFFLTPLAAMPVTGYTPPGQVLQVPIEYELSGLTIQVINAGFMNKARYLGLKVQAWTINDPDEMRWLMDEMQVDGIMSDDPELLEEIIHE